MIKILDFYADWCNPCKQLSPILEEIERTLDYVTIQKINVEEDIEAANSYGIRNIPTLLILKDDNLVDKIIGMVPKEKILNTINKWK